MFKTLEKKLTKAFIQYQYNLDHPFPHPVVTEEELVAKYQTDPIFHAKVSTIVAGVLNIVDGECNCKD